MYDANILLKMSQKLRPEMKEIGVRWKYVHRPDGRLILFPVEPPPVLFRGQNKRYSPSYPSICRNFERVAPKLSELSLDDQASLLINLAKSWWFSRELDTHPAMRWAEQQNIYVNQMALAQHYELPTGYMDVSQSFDVASFFATCYRDKRGWHPVTAGVGVIYRVDYVKAPKPLEFAAAIGLQPFPRPAEHHRTSHGPPMGLDFETLPVISRIEFTQDEAVSRHFLKLFGDGASLFPPDPLSNVADRIKHSEEIPKDLIDLAIKDVTGDQFGVNSQNANALRDRIAEKIDLVDQLVVLRPEDINSMNSIWDKRKEKFVWCERGKVAVRVPDCRIRLI